MLPLPPVLVVHAHNMGRLGLTARGPPPLLKAFSLILHPWSHGIVSQLRLGHPNIAPRAVLLLPCNCVSMHVADTGTADCWH